MGFIKSMRLVKLFLLIATVLLFLADLVADWWSESLRSFHRG